MSTMCEGNNRHKGRYKTTTVHASLAMPDELKPRASHSLDPDSRLSPTLFAP